MNYQTFQSHSDLKAFVKCYWILEVPSEIDAPKQRIIPDGCIEMIFTLGDDIKRFISEMDFIIQPRAMVMGQITEPFFIQPTGHVNTFAVRFYPYSFANFVNIPISELSNKETPISELFEEEESKILEKSIMQASGTEHRIEIIERFLMDKLNNVFTIDKIVQTTIEALLATNGSSSINSLIEDDQSKRRHLERKFSKQIGLSPKQLGKVIRLQAALKMLLNKNSGSLTHIAYDNDYYDQAHFNRDFKEFTGLAPSDFEKSENMLLSSVIYKKD